MSHRRSENTENLPGPRSPLDFIRNKSFTPASNKRSPSDKRARKQSLRNTLITLFQSDRGVIHIPVSMYLIPHVWHFLPIFLKNRRHSCSFHPPHVEALTVVQNKPSVFLRYNRSNDIWYASIEVRHVLGKASGADLPRQESGLAASVTPKHSLIREDFPQYTSLQQQNYKLVGEGRDVRELRCRWPGLGT